MTEEQSKVIDQLRDSGHVLIIWTPEEVGACPGDVLEDRCTEAGWDTINDLTNGPNVDEEE